ncbi:cyclopropane-fatty-acyl-phospholipid synthase [Tanacetum coccineum]
MTYSCAVFKSEDEDLKSAQMRKITSLIDKPRVKKNHRVLGIGCDWGTLAIELVKRTGCSYTGITLSEEQLKYAENKFISIPDQRYDEYRRSSDFIKEYIFPGGCLPSLSRVTSAMAASSRLCKIRALGFDQKFIGTWEYYFDYCAAGFKTHTLGGYQVVFSSPGNSAALQDPYEGFPRLIL